MSGAVLVALVAAVGNLLQGWDNATIAGNLPFLHIFIPFFSSYAMLYRVFQNSKLDSPRLRNSCMLASVCVT